MGHQLREFPFTEAEGGVPEVSVYDIGMAHGGIGAKNYYLPYQDSGVTKGSSMFPGVAGFAPEGLQAGQPSVIPDFYYLGEFPLDMQPSIVKPKPWE